MATDGDGKEKEGYEGTEDSPSPHSPPWQSIIEIHRILWQRPSLKSHGRQRSVFELHIGGKTVRVQLRNSLALNDNSNTK
jgi:hypothetical protein